MTLTVRCTREEYMQFCAATAPRPVWLTAAGLLLAALAAAEAVLLSGITQVGLLVLFGAVICLLACPLIIPTWCKGAAGRRYDNSDDLRQAVHVTFSQTAVTVHSATVEGTLPMTAVTGVVKTNDMLAVAFGKELTVHIPLRAMTEEESAAVMKMLKKGTHNHGNDSGK